MIICSVEVYGYHAGLHRVGRRQRQMVIRDRHMAVFAVRGSDRLNGLRTARTAIWIIAVRISHPDLCVLRTGRVVGQNMACFHRPLTCTAPLPGEYASSALASPSKRDRREIARAAAGSEVVCT